MRYYLKGFVFFCFFCASFYSHGDVLPDADEIQKKIVDAIYQTPVTATATVTLESNKHYYFNFTTDVDTGVHGISIPRSNFIFNGNNATIHVVTTSSTTSCNIHSLNGTLFQVAGLMQGNQQSGFDPSKTYLFPKPGTSTSVSVTFSAHPTFPGQQNVASISNVAARELGVENVIIKNLTIQYDGSQKCSKDWNSVTAYYGHNITLDNVKVINSPATSFAILSDKTNYFLDNATTATSNTHPTSNVTLNRCSSVNSVKEAYRFNSNSNITTFEKNGSVTTAADSSGSPAGISASLLESSAYSVWRDGMATETYKRPYHVVYYPGYIDATVSFTTVSNSQSKRALLIDHSFFDYTGEIYSASGAPNLSITHSDIWGGIYLFSGYSAQDVRSVANANIIGNYLNGYYAKPELCVTNDNTKHEGIIRIDNLNAVKVIGNNISADKCGYIDYLYQGVAYKGYVPQSSTHVLSSNYWLDGANGIILQQ